MTPLAQQLRHGVLRFQYALPREFRDAVNLAADLLEAREAGRITDDMVQAFKKAFYDTRVFDQNADIRRGLEVVLPMIGRPAVEELVADDEFVAAFLTALAGRRTENRLKAGGKAF